MKDSCPFVWRSFINVSVRVQCRERQLPRKHPLSSLLGLWIVRAFAGIVPEQLGASGAPGPSRLAHLPFLRVQKKTMVAVPGTSAFILSRDRGDWVSAPTVKKMGLSPRWPSSKWVVVEGSLSPVSLPSPPHPCRSFGLLLSFFLKPLRTSSRS